ncbi:hypothetical protein [Arthrobacter bambusae]|uniref:hypothetical protein n=1 Tax=Arthrobacter bambusae TaxID=1338426 RepID=UPI003398DF9A
MAPGTRSSFAVRSNSARSVAASKGCSIADVGDDRDDVVAAGDDAADSVDDAVDDEVGGAGGPELQETVAARAAAVTTVNAALTETCMFRVMATPVERY